MRIAAGIMLLLLLLSAAVQWNDPDPVRWMLLYGAGAALSALALARKYTPFAPLLFALYVAVAVYLMPTWNPSEVADLLSQPKMVNHDVELAREALGLMIGAVWMLVLSWAWWRGQGIRNEDSGATT